MTYFLFTERARSYIESKTERLKSARRWAFWQTIFVWATIVALWSFETVTSGEAIVAALVASAWYSIMDAVCNLHIDLLTMFKHDLDRDEADGAAEFHTP